MHIISLRKVIIEGFYQEEAIMVVLFKNSLLFKVSQPKP